MTLRGLNFIEIVYPLYDSPPRFVQTCFHLHCSNEQIKESHKEQLQLVTSLKTKETNQHPDQINSLKEMKNEIMSTY